MSNALDSQCITHLKSFSTKVATALILLFFLLFVQSFGRSKLKSNWIERKVVRQRKRMNAHIRRQKVDRKLKFTSAINTFLPVRDTLKTNTNTQKPIVVTIYFIWLLLRKSFLFAFFCCLLAFGYCCCCCFCSLVLPTDFKFSVFGVTVDCLAICWFQLLNGSIRKSIIWLWYCDVCLSMLLLLLLLLTYFCHYYCYHFFCNVSCEAELKECFSITWDIYSNTNNGLLVHDF